MKSNKIVAIVLLLMVAISCKNKQSDINTQPKPGPAPKIKFGKAEKFKLSNGLQVILVENHKLPRAAAYLSLNNKPVIEGKKAGVSSFMGSLLGRGTQNISKDTFNEKVDFMGAQIGFGSHSASASSLKKYFPEVLQLMADAVKNPKFDKEELAKEKMQTIDRLVRSGADVGKVASKIKDVLNFGKDHPYGEFITKETVNNITIKDVVSNYKTYFKPNNAFLTVVGDINIAETKERITTLFGDWKQGDIPQQSIPTPKNSEKTEITFVNMPNAVQSSVILSNNIELELGDKDMYAVVLANNILGGGMSGRLFKNLREDKGYTYGAYSGVELDKYGSIFSASASVRNQVTDSAVVEFRNELDKIRKELVSDEELTIAKAQYTGNFVRNVEKPQTVANFALNIVKHNLPEDFYVNYLENINNVTKEDIQRVAKKYFLLENNKILVVGKADDVLTNLEKIGLPVNYLSTDGETIEKPKSNIVAVEKGITAATVIDNYFKAIGGTEKISKVKTIKNIATTSMQGMSLKVISKSAHPNKRSTVMEGNGQVMQKQVFDGKKGYVAMQGQVMDMSKEEVEEFKNETAPFAEFAFKKGTLKGIEKINGKDAYTIILNKKKAFFDVASGLKVKEEITQVDAQGEFVISTSYSNYKTVNGIKFPHTVEQDMGGGPKMKFKLSEILINKEVSEADFK